MRLCVTNSVHYVLEKTQRSSTIDQTKELDDQALASGSSRWSGAIRPFSFRGDDEVAIDSPLSLIVGDGQRRSDLLGLRQHRFQTGRE